MAIDIIFVIVAGYGFYLGFSRGIIQTVFTILSYMFGLMAALRFAQPMSSFLEEAFDYNNPLMFIAGFLLTFILTMMLIRLFARGLEGFLEVTNINLINQIAGGALLAMIFVMGYSVILWFADNTTLLQDTKDTSMTYEYLEKYPTYVWQVGETVKPLILDFYEQSSNFMDELEELSRDKQVFSRPEEESGN